MGSVPNTGLLDGNGDKGSAKGNIKTPVQRSEAKAGQLEAQPSKVKAPKPPTKRTPDDTLRVAERPLPDPKQRGQGATGPRRYAQLHISLAR
ncbi:hypothetical protein JTB14_038129 [Gonioctena quinquepunctata]|nr:hypothetical protein JTB14_038129 [Gonioctena quinquepunctata]